MPNGYSVIPNILPGNVTIGGNLTVAGDQITVGAIAPFLRLGRASSLGPPFIGGNIGFDLASIDVARPGWALLFDAANRKLVMREVNSAAAVQDTSLSQGLLTDYTLHAHTGTTTEDTIYSKLIRANIMGNNGGLMMRLYWTFSAQGGVASTVRIRFGATLIEAEASAAVGQRYAEFLFLNQNAANSNRDLLRVHNMATNAWTNVNATDAIDTSVDQTLNVTVQSGAVGDIQNFFVAELSLLNSFGPV